MLIVYQGMYNQDFQTFSPALHEHWSQDLKNFPLFSIQLNIKFIILINTKLPTISTIFTLLFRIKMLTIVLILIFMRIYFMLTWVLNEKKKSNSARTWASFQKWHPNVNIHPHVNNVLSNCNDLKAPKRYFLKRKKESHPRACSCQIVMI